MKNTGTVFHSGERELQKGLGLGENMESWGKQAILDYMPEQHRDFYAGLSFIWLGFVDSVGNPWASVVSGNVGFIQSPNSRCLMIPKTILVGDVLTDAVNVGMDIAALGIELSTRRRNRISATVQEITADTIVLRVKQAFGNCPKYIQYRNVYTLESVSNEPEVYHASELNNEAIALIGWSDTFFIASHLAGERDYHGADVSHRGGKKGFVHVSENHVLTIPDFSGNNYFNTLGNFALNPRAGLTFVDFENGDILMLTGDVNLSVTNFSLKDFSGAERFWSFKPTQMTLIKSALSWRAELFEMSPFLENTGSWP